MNTNELEVVLNEWVKVLGLSDWKIALIVNCTEEETEGCEALTKWKETIKDATIRILANDTYYKVQDIEQTIVHELLHLKTSFLDPFKETEISLGMRFKHQLIDDLARSFVQVKRGVFNNKGFVKVINNEDICYHQRD